MKYLFPGNSTPLFRLLLAAIVACIRFLINQFLIKKCTHAVCRISSLSVIVINKLISSMRIGDSNTQFLYSCAYSVLFVWRLS